MQQVAPFNCTSSRVPPLPGCFHDHQCLLDILKVALLSDQPRFEYLPLRRVVRQAPRQTYREYQCPIERRHRQLTYKLGDDIDGLDNFWYTCKPVSQGPTFLCTAITPTWNWIAQYCVQIQECCLPVYIRHQLPRVNDGRNSRHSLQVRVLTDREVWVQWSVIGFSGVHRLA